jgi:hypothetical protein
VTGPLVPTNDRIWGPFRALVNLLLQPTRFYGTYEYTITGTDGTTVNGTPNDPSLNLPSINGAELRADSIATQTPTVGNLCHIIFVNGDPARFKCSWCAPPPTAVSIAGGADYVALAGLVKDDFTILANAAAMTPAGPSEPGFKAFAAALVTANFPLPVAASKVKAT